MILAGISTISDDLVNNYLLIAQTIAGSVFLILSIYNVMLYIVLKKDLYIYYGLTVGFLSAHIFLPGMRYLGWFDGADISVLTASATGFTFVWFTKNFQQIDRSRYPLWNYSFNIINYLLILVFFINGLNLTLFQHELTDKITAFTAAFGNLFVVVLSFFSSYRLRKKERMAQLYLYTITPSLLACIIYTFAWLMKQFLPDGDYSFAVYAFLGIETFQFMLFSLVISFSVKEYELARLEKQKKLNDYLEEEVEKHTRHLREANEKIQTQNKQLSELNEVKNKVFSVVTHDIRNSINQLFGMVAVLKSPETTEKDRVMLIDYLNTRLNNTSEIIDRTLNWSTSQMKGINPKFEQVRIIDMLKEIVEFQSDAIHKKGLKIHIDCSPGISVLVDREMLTSAVRNLTSNAIKFSYPEMDIYLTAKTEEDHAVIKVKDLGTGMEKNWFENLVDEREMVSAPGTGGETGKGFGLLIAQDFVNINQGELTCESQKGEGTTFTIKIPLFKK